MTFPAVHLTRRTALVATAALVGSPLARARTSHAAATAVAAGDDAPPGGLAPTLASVYAGQVDPALCLVSEKYDGVRAVWDGRVLRHRSGRAVSVPPAFVAALPAIPLDGELWLGRGRFDELSGVVRKKMPLVDEWGAVLYMVFEMPGEGGGFAERAERLAALVARSGARHLVAAPQLRGTDRVALQRRLEATIAAGGEGLMLHVASAPWSPGRSDALLKLKPHLDAEAKVVGHRGGVGKYSGQLGALDVETGDGRRFRVGSGLSDALRRDPPAAGEVITYRYRDLTPRGLPRFATYVRRYEGF
ncbi:MAG: DNA ligase [Caldimonas sp.]